MYPQSPKATGSSLFAARRRKARFCLRWARPSQKEKLRSDPTTTGFPPTAGCVLTLEDKELGSPLPGGPSGINREITDALRQCSYRDFEASLAVRFRVFRRESQFCGCRWQARDNEIGVPPPDPRTRRADTVRDDSQSGTVALAEMPPA